MSTTPPPPSIRDPLWSYDKLCAKYDALLTAFQDQGKEFQVLKVENNDFTHEVAVLQADIDEGQTELEDAQKQVAEGKKQAQEVQELLYSAYADNDALRDSNERYKYDYDQVSASLERADFNHQQLQFELDRAKVDLSAFKEGARWNGDFNQGPVDSDTNTNKLHEELQELTAKFKRSEDKLQHCGSARQILENKWRDARDHNAHLAARLEKLDKRLKRLKAKGVEIEQDSSDEEWEAECEKCVVWKEKLEKLVRAVGVYEKRVRDVVGEVSRDLGRLEIVEEGVEEEETGELEEGYDGLEGDHGEEGKRDEQEWDKDSLYDD